MAKLIQGTNDLESCSPRLLKEWNYAKNQDCTPYSVAINSNKKVWWICDNGHEWEARIADRYRGSQCPYCSGRLPIVGKNDLATMRPDIAAEWHPTKNVDMLPSMFTAGSGKKIWWLGTCGHEWQQTINDRTNNHGCPKCGKIRGAQQRIKKALKEKGSLSENNSLLALEWHPVKNGNLTPDMVTSGSNKQVWWLGKCGHEWPAYVNNRNKGEGCPFCAGQKIEIGFNDLATINPQVASEWHPTKNGELTPQMVTANSTFSVWWICAYGHEWKTAIHVRNRGRGCPTCYNRIRTSFPEQALFFYIKQLYPAAVNGYRDKKNNISEIDIFIPQIKTGIEYDGIRWHNSATTHERDYVKYKNCKRMGIRLIRVREMNAIPDTLENCDECFPITPQHSSKELDICIESVIERLTENSCKIQIDSERDEQAIKEQYLFLPRKGSFLIDNPELEIEWHPTKNGRLTPELFSAGTNEKVWWICNKGHEWKAPISARVRGSGCPVCAYPKRDKKRYKELLLKNGSLEDLRPDIAAEWHPYKNGDLLPSMVTASSKTKAWFICSACGNEWQSTISDRYRALGCPHCGFKCISQARHAISLEKNGNLLEKNPAVAKDWHPSKNGKRTPDGVTPNCGDKVWWLGECGHEWTAEIKARNKGQGCPFCANKRVLPGFNDLVTTNRTLAEEWHPTKNEGLSPQMVTSGSNKRAWWLGKCGHEWNATIGSRNAGAGCPICYQANRKKK